MVQLSFRSALGTGGETGRTCSTSPPCRVGLGTRGRIGAAERGIRLRDGSIPITGPFGVEFMSMEELSMVAQQQMGRLQRKGNVMLSRSRFIVSLSFVLLSVLAAAAVNVPATAQAAGSTELHLKLFAYGDADPTMWTDSLHAFLPVAGSVITLEIDDPSNGIGVDYSDTLVADSEGSALFELWGVFEVGPGFVITVADDQSPPTIETMVVPTVTLDFVDLGADVVSGTADPGERAEVSINPFGPNRVNLWVVADGAGEWSADFSGLFDIRPFTEGQIEVVPGVEQTVGVFWLARPEVEIAVPEYEAPDGVLDQVIFASRSEPEDIVDIGCVGGVVDHFYPRAVVLDRDSGQAGISAVVSNDIIFTPGTKANDLTLMRSCIEDGTTYYVYNGFAEE